VGGGLCVAVCAAFDDAVQSTTAKTPNNNTKTQYQNANQPALLELMFNGIL
jgi:hypothetical protein